MTAHLHEADSAGVVGLCPGDSEPLVHLEARRAASRKVFCELLTALPEETRQVLEALLEYCDDNDAHMRAWVASR